MKVHEIIPQQLDEKSAWRKAIAAGALAASSLTPRAVADAQPPSNHNQPINRQVTRQYEPPTDEIVSRGHRIKMPEPKDQLRRSELTNKIASHYRVDRKLVQDIVDLAFKYERPDFPKAEDILAVIGVESSFNPDSVSSLLQDPARGLMQIRPGVWDIDPNHLDDLENQIKFGARILTQYYRRLGTAEAALQAYNLGITHYRRGRRNERYVARVDNIRDFLD